MTNVTYYGANVEGNICRGEVLKNLGSKVKRVRQRVLMSEKIYLSKKSKKGVSGKW